MLIVYTKINWEDSKLYHCSLLTRYYNKKNSNCTSRHSNYCCGGSFVVTAYKPSLRILYCILRGLQLFQTSVNFQLLSVFHLRNTINTTYSHIFNMGWPTTQKFATGYCNLSNQWKSSFIKVHPLECRAGYSGTKFNDKVYSS